MDIGRAQSELTRLTSGDERYKYDAFGYQAIGERYDAAGAPERARILDVLVTVLLEGTAHEQDFVAGFLVNNQPPPGVATRLVDAYIARGDSDLAPLQRVLGSFTAQLDEADTQRLADVFVADPVTHLALAEHLLSRIRGNPVYNAFAKAVAECTDLDTLKRAFSAAYVGKRVDEFFALLSARDDDFLRLLAMHLPSGYGDQLLEYHQLS